VGNKQNIGSIEWRDLTVENAESVSDFYQQVIGWQREAVSMGSYNDFNMNLPQSDGSKSGDTVPGVCHAKGDNAGLPAQWMMYVRVADVEKSVRSVKSLDGKVISGPRSFGGDTYYVIQDPAGAVLTLFSN